MDLLRNLLESCVVMNWMQVDGFVDGFVGGMWYLVTDWQS